MFRTTRRLTAVSAAVAAVALVPAGASAQTWFGSSLNHSPANAGSTCAENGVMGPALCTHVGSFYPGTSGRARAPRSGTIVAFKVRAEGPTQMTFKVVSVRNVDALHHHGQAKAEAKGRTVQVHGPTQDQADNGISPVETFSANLRVRKGQEIAIDTTSNTAEYCSDGTPGQLLYDPILGLGQGFRAASGVDHCLMLVRAVVR